MRQPESDYALEETFVEAGEVVESRAVRAVHTISSIQAALGGPSRSVTALCGALAAQGVAVELVTKREEAELVYPAAAVTVRFVERGAWQWVRLRGSALVQELTAALTGDAAVLHDHGLWLPEHHLAAVAAERAGAPLVVSIRGMLSPWALGQNRLKKRTAWVLFQRRALATAALIHATSEAEVEHVRRLGFQQAVALLPNGVEMPEALRLARSKPRQVLFLGRLHPVKGLLNLVQAWAQVRPAGWELVLAGPDADGHRAEVERAASGLGIAETVRFTGSVGDEDKWGLYGGSDVFVLPTFSENFGIVAAEALAAGVPVITTKGAPWQDLETHDCGWWVEIGVEPLARALAEAVSLSDDQRQAMGQRGRALVERKYSWAHVAEEMSSVYRWLLGQGSQPNCVV